MSEKPNNVDYYTYEDAMFRAERHTKRWIMAFFVVLMALIVTNVGWIVYESSFEDVTTTVTQESSSDGGGDSIIYGNHAGEVTYGESETNSNN